MTTADVIIVGAGPAGSACAALCAAAGLQTLVLEREQFPREKVCGDCLNRDCWPILEKLGVADEVCAAAHAEISEVEIRSVSGRRFCYPAPQGERGEISIKRRFFDTIVARRATVLGARVLHGCAVSKLKHAGGTWEVTAGEETYLGRFLIAADGRNSTVARLAGVLPASGRNRVAIQAHLPCPSHHAGKISLQLLPNGYCGVADVGDGQLNVCLVSQPRDLQSLKTWAANEFECGADTEWRSITPLERRPVSPLHENLILAGDAARIVEPFTGEGIYYALASGTLVSRFLSREIDGGEFLRRYRSLYSGRLWINRLARVAVTHPLMASRVLDRVPSASAVLGLLTAKVVGGDGKR